MKLTLEEAEKILKTNPLSRLLDLKEGEEISFIALDDLHLIKEGENSLLGFKAKWETLELPIRIGREKKVLRTRPALAKRIIEIALSNGLETLRDTTWRVKRISRFEYEVELKKKKVEKEVEIREKPQVQEIEAEEEESTETVGKTQVTETEESEEIEIDKELLNDLKKLEGTPVTLESLSIFLSLRTGRDKDEMEKIIRGFFDRGFISIDQGKLRIRKESQEVRE